MAEQTLSTSNLSFAWENYAERELQKTNQSFQFARKICNKTDILVIIGYSFPIFNRTIDKELFNEMTQLERVYVQTDQFDKIGSILQNDFMKPLGFKIDKEITNVGFTDQFFIPPEWDSEKQKRPNLTSMFQ